MIAQQGSRHASPRSGTIGGSLAEADPSGDWGAVLLTLDTSVRCSRPSGERPSRWTIFSRMPIPPSSDTRNWYVKSSSNNLPQKVEGPILAFKRSAPVYGHSAAHTGRQRYLQRNSDCAGLRGIDGYAAKTETFSQRGLFDEKRIEDAVEAARAVAEPQDDMRGSAEYKRVLIAALVKRAIGIAVRRARGEQIEAGHEYVGR